MKEWKTSLKTLEFEQRPWLSWSTAVSDFFRPSGAGLSSSILLLGRKAGHSVNAGHLYVSWGIFRPSRTQLSELRLLQVYTHSALAKHIIRPWVILKNTQVQVQLRQAREEVGLQPEVQTRSGPQHLVYSLIRTTGCFLVPQEMRTSYHLALSTCFPIFHLEVCTFPAVGHPSWKHSQISGDFQRNVQLTPGTQSLHKIFAKDPKWLTFKKTHTTHKISPPLNQKFIVSNPKMGPQGTNSSAPRNQLICHSWVESELLGRGHN